MSRLANIIAFSVAAVLVAVSAPAQHGRVKPPQEQQQRIVRATVVDEDGLRQWAPFKAERCPLCSGRKVEECDVCARWKSPEGCPFCEGTKKAPCRACFGTGQTWDPLECMPCPGCATKGKLPCRMCGAKGGYPVEGSGDREQKCVSCRGDRVFECEICDGERRIGVVEASRGPLGEAELDDLKKTREAIVEARDELRKFTGDARASKAAKAFEKAVKPARRCLPWLKEAAKMLENDVKALEKGAMFVATPQHIADEQAGFRDRTLWAFDHSIELLDLCIERAEANAAVAEKK